MSYDKNGLGIAEMTFISVNYPEIWDTIYTLFDTNEQEALSIARKVIECKNRGII